MGAEIHDDGFDGFATLTVGDVTLTEAVVLRGYFEPADGRYHWYGRVAAEAAWGPQSVLNADCRIGTPYGFADGLLGDPDAWGRMRIAGTGRPPFPTDLLSFDAIGR